MPSKITKDIFKKTLYDVCGNITHAGIVLEISRMHAFRLTKKYELGDYARELRTQYGHAATGKPRVHPIGYNAL